MKRRAYLAQFAGLLCGTAFAGPALSADLYRPPAPAPAAVPVPAYLDEWSGVYVGLEGGFGWGRQKFESASITGFGSSIGDVARSGGTTLFPAFNGPNGARSIGQSGALFGGFAGVQKQWANWVLGFEADVDVSWIRGSSASSGVQNGVRVSSLQFGSPAVPAVPTGPAEVPLSTAQATGSQATGSQATAAQATPAAAASRASSSTSAAAAAAGGTAPASFQARWPSVTVSTTVSGFALAAGRGAAGAAGGGAAGAGTGAAGAAGTAAAGAAGTGAAATQGASSAAAAAAAAASAAAGTRPAAGAAGSGAAASGGTAPAPVPTITVSTTIRGLAAAGTGAATGTGNAATTASATSTSAGGGGSGRTGGGSASGGSASGGAAAGGAGSGGAASGGTAPASAVSWAGAPQAPGLQQLTALTNVSRTVSVDSRIDELGSLRGKFGFTPAPQWLIYATGGLAFAHVTNNVIATESFAADFGSGTRNFSRSLSTSGGATLFGWALGAGVDWKWTDTNWIVGVEYLHYDFPAHTLALGDSGGGSSNLVNSRQSVDAVKGRISYLFPIH